MYVIDNFHISDDLFWAIFVVWLVVSLFVLFHWMESL